MSQTNIILEDLKTELEDNIANLAECKRGIFQFEDMINKPAIAFWSYKNELEEHLMDGLQIRILRVYIYYYTNGIEAIHDLVEATEDFLYNDFSHKSNIFIGDVTIYEGGAADPICIAEQEITIRFERSYK